MSTTIPEIHETAELKMGKSLESFKGELQKIRTGRAHPGTADAGLGLGSLSMGSMEAQR